MNPSPDQTANPILENELRAMERQWERIEQEEAAEKRAQAATRKLETNRQNARKSTGPRTEAGKAASSKNRLAHGLCSSSLIIRGESQEDFDELLTQTRSAFNPQTQEETLLVDQLVEALWRLNRARRVESQTFEMMMASTSRRMKNMEQPTETLLGSAFFDPFHQKALATVHRYVTAAERTYRQCLKAVQEAVRRRVVEKPKPQTAKAGQSFPREAGFESQFIPQRPENAPAYPDRC